MKIYCYTEPNSGENEVCQPKQRDLAFLFRGDDRTIPLHLVDRNGNDIDITNWKIYFTLKLNKTDTDAEAELKKDVTTHITPLGGKTAIPLTNEDTDELTVGKLYHDIQAKNDNGQIFTITYGTIEIKEDITLRID